MNADLPPGAIAPGIDRIVMLLCGEENLRGRAVPDEPVRRRLDDGSAVGSLAEAAPRAALAKPG